MSELERIFKENGGRFEEKRIGEIFEIGTGSLLKAGDLENGPTKRISVKSSDNGIIGSYKTLHLKEARHFENFISVNFFGGVYYHPYSASVEMKVHTLKGKKFEFTKSSGLYFASIIEKILAGKFSYGNQLSSSKLKEGDFFIQVPTKITGEIDFEYMEQHIKELEAENIKELEAYLLATGLSDYTLTRKEQSALDKFAGGINKVYRIEELFESYNGNFDIKKEHINGKGDYVITAGLTQNGVLGKTDIEAKIFNEKTITIDMFGFAFYRDFKYKMVTHARVFSVEPKFEITSKKGLYLSTNFHYFNKKFGYENMCSWAKIKDLEISLPTLNGNIDFEFMEDFISAIQKLVIKDVVIWTERKMKAYREVVGR